VLGAAFAVARVGATAATFGNPFVVGGLLVVGGGALVCQLSADCRAAFGSFVDGAIEAARGFSVFNEKPTVPPGQALNVNGATTPAPGDPNNNGDDDDERSRLDVRIVETDGDVMQIAARGARGDITIVTRFVREGNRLILSRLDVGGLSRGASSIGELRQIAREIGRQTGVESVVIRGNVRQSGANIGKVPREITIKVPK
jgi:hypothetical protein